ncbi:MAG: ankyrin repeat domain-containing protein [Pseudomonadota bacterium]
MIARAGLLLLLNVAIANLAVANELAAALRACNLAQVENYVARGLPIPREVDGKSPLVFCHREPAIVRALLVGKAAVRPASFQLLIPPIWGGNQVQWLSILHLYLQHDLDLNARGPIGETAVFHLAGQSANGVSVLQELLRQGADANLTANNGDTPLQNAVRYDHLVNAQLLLLHGADVQTVNKNGQTALEIALLWRPKPNPAMAELLVEHGANPNQRVRLATSAKATQPLLHGLIRSKRYESVKLLMRLGAEPQQTDSEQQTAVDVARASGDPLLLRAVQSN